MDNRTSLTEQQGPVEKLVFELSKLPGIGEKSAVRLAYFIMKQDDSYAENLASAIRGSKTEVILCSECFNFAHQDPCRICANPERSVRQICVVEKPSDISAIEGSGSFTGKYHVLHGVISPLDGIGPDDLKISPLLQRLENGVEEVIVATNPSVEGDATALYLSRLLTELGVKVSRLSYGLSVGGSLEYTDRQTISKAIEHRMQL